MILGAMLALLGVVFLFFAAAIGARAGADDEREKIARHLRKRQAQEATGNRFAEAHALCEAAEDVEIGRHR